MAEIPTPRFHVLRTSVKKLVGAIGFETALKHQLKDLTSTADKFWPLQVHDAIESDFWNQKLIFAGRRVFKRENLCVVKVMNQGPKTPITN
jgi:hypothetical protein